MSSPRVRPVWTPTPPSPRLCSSYQVPCYSNSPYGSDDMPQSLTCRIDEMHPEKTLTKTCLRTKYPRHPGSAPLQVWMEVVLSPSYTKRHWSEYLGGHPVNAYWIFRDSRTAPSFSVGSALRISIAKLTACTAVPGAYWRCKARTPRGQKRGALSVARLQLRPSPKLAFRLFGALVLPGIGAYRSLSESASS